MCDVSKCAGIVCCINWWANHVKDFPNLARMSRQYLGVPATSATVERLFSVVGFAFTDRRKSQSAETLANLAFAITGQGHTGVVYREKKNVPR